MLIVTRWFRASLLLSGIAVISAVDAPAQAAEPVTSNEQVQTSAAAPAPSQAAEPLVAQGGLSSAPAAAASQPLTPAQQVKGLYVTTAIGANWPMNVAGFEVTNTFGTDYNFTDHHTAGLSVEAGLGYDFGAFRAELTYANDSSYLSSYTDPFGAWTYTTQGSVNKQSVLVSGYWDINLNSRFSPYIGGGIGYSYLSVGSASDQFATYSPYSAGRFAYQFKGGLSYLASRNSDVFAEAVYRGMTGYTANDGGIVYNLSSYNSWGFQIGVRYRF